MSQSDNMSDGQTKFAPATPNYGNRVATLVRVVNDADDPIDIAGVTSGTFSPQGLGTGKIAIISLTTTWVEATTGAVNPRSNLAVQNQSGGGGVILWNYVNIGSDGFRIEDGGFRSVLLNSNSTAKVYIRMLSGSGSAAVEETGP